MYQERLPFPRAVLLCFSSLVLCSDICSLVSSTTVSMCVRCTSIAVWKVFLLQPRNRSKQTVHINMRPFLPPACIMFRQANELVPWMNIGFKRLQIRNGMVELFGLNMCVMLNTLWWCVCLKAGGPVVHPSRLWWSKDICVYRENWNSNQANELWGYSDCCVWGSL